MMKSSGRVGIVTYLLTRAVRQSALELEHGAGDLVLEGRLALVVVHWSSLVVVLGCAGGGGSLVVFAGEARHEGGLGAGSGASCVGHFECGLSWFGWNNVR